MKCTRCGKRDAVMHYTETINGVTKEEHLCAACAGEDAALSGGFFESPFGMAEAFFAPFAGLTQKAAPAAGKACPLCGARFEDILRAGKPGCAKCYETFREELRPSVKKAQGALKHIGAAPDKAEAAASAAPQNELAALEAALKEAIEKEEFERAASLRDQIREKKGESA